MGMINMTKLLHNAFNSCLLVGVSFYTFPIHLCMHFYLYKFMVLFCFYESGTIQYILFCNLLFPLIISLNDLSVSVYIGILHSFNCFLISKKMYRVYSAILY